MKNLNKNQTIVTALKVNVLKVTILKVTVLKVTILKVTVFKVTILGPEERLVSQTASIESLNQNNFSSLCVVHSLNGSASAACLANVNREPGTHLNARPPLCQGWQSGSTLAVKKIGLYGSLYTPVHRSPKWPNYSRRD